MLGDALSYPTKGDNGVVRLLLGGVLSLLSFLVLPGLAVGGYYVRTLGAAADGHEEPPAFEDWGGLMVDGLKAGVIGLVYGLIPFAMMLVMVLVMIGGSMTGDLGSIFAGIGLLGILVASVLSFVIQFLVPAALVNFARERSISAAFDFGTLKPILTSSEYIVAVVLTFVLAVSGGVLFGIFAVMTFGFGIIVAPFFYFWLYLAGCYMFGAACGDVTDQSDDQKEFGVNATVSD